MKTSFPNTTLTVLTIIFLTTMAGGAAIIFTDNFEGDLSKWTGQNGGPHAGVIVPDPVGSGRGGVLTFTNLTSGGAALTTNAFTPTGTFVIGFDYLGLAMAGSVPGDLGGFLGISDSLLVPEPSGWLAGTQDGYTPGLLPLTDDGTWHHYTITLSGAVTGTFHLAIEDYSGSGGVPGDAFFDNISIQTVTGSPASLSIGVYAGVYAGVEITGTVGAIYSVEYATELPTTNWTSITNMVLPTSPYLFFDPKSINNTASRFYRVVAAQ